jgi:hypothetical protein
VSKRIRSRKIFVTSPSISHNSPSAHIPESTPNHKTHVASLRTCPAP